jgi:hypothetical protein
LTALSRQACAAVWLRDLLRVGKLASVETASVAHPQPDYDSTLLKLDGLKPSVCALRRGVGFLRLAGLVEKVTAKRESAVRRDLFIAQSISKIAKLR